MITRINVRYIGGSADGWTESREAIHNKEILCVMKPVRVGLASNDVLMEGTHRLVRERYEVRQWKNNIGEYWVAFYEGED